MVAAVKLSDNIGNRKIRLAPLATYLFNEIRIRNQNGLRYQFRNDRELLMEDMPYDNALKLEIDGLDELLPHIQIPG